MATFSLIATAKLNDAAPPRARLAGVIARIADHPASRPHELLPRNWKVAWAIPAEPINTLAETLALPQLAERGMLVEVEYPPGSGNRILTAGMPWRGVAREGPVRSPPALGEHTADILKTIGRGRTP